MIFKKIFKSLIITGVLFSHLWAGELRIKNDATTPVEVTVRAKENQSSASPFTVIQTIQPGEEITVTLDEKKFSGTTFSIQGITVITLPALPLISNECVLSGCEGRVVFTPRSDGTALVCGVTKTE